MKRKFIPVEGSFQRWTKDPNYAAACDSLQNEFTLASASIEARVHPLSRGLGAEIVSLFHGEGLQQEIPELCGQDAVPADLDA